MLKFYTYLLSLSFLIFFSGCQQAAQKDFISVNEGQFIRNGKSYHYIGTNYWYGASLAADTIGGDRMRLTKELDFLKALGIDNLRIMWLQYQRRRKV